MHSRLYFLEALKQTRRRNLVLAIVLLLLILSVVPWQAAHSAELNVSQNQLPVTLGRYLDYFEDRDGSLTIDDVLRGGVPWQRSSQDIPTLGISKSAHWFKIILTAAGTLNSDLALMLDSSIIDQVEFYFIQDNAVVRKSIVGDAIPLSQLDYPFRIPIIPFRLNSQEAPTQIIFRATSSVGVEMPLTLSTISQIANSQQTQLVFLGGLLSLFMLSFFCCGILYYFLRDMPFLAFTVFFGGATVFFMAQTGLGRIWIWGEIGEANTRISLLAGCILLASLCLIGRSIALDSRYKESINTVLRFINYAMIPTGLYFLLIPFQQISADNVVPLMTLAFLVALTVLIMAGITALQGSKTAFYLFTSWLMLILAYSTFLAYKTKLIELGPSTPVIGESFAIISALLLLMSIAEFVRAKNEELVEARLGSKAKADFLRNVSREFLTPVHLILANSKRLLASQSNKLDEVTRQHMSTVIKQSDYLHKLINDLLEMAELESDNFEPEFELLEISHFLNEVKDMIVPSAQEKGLDIITQFASANLLVQSDKSRLQHALINILTNSIKYTEKGSIRIGYKAVYFRRRLGIEISIQDTGRGMSEEFQRRLFQEFSREEDDAERALESTGLGMVIVKRMIEKLGGEIEFQSLRHEGSTFFVRLPLRVVQG